MVKIKQDIKTDLLNNLKRSGVSFPDRLAKQIYNALPRRLQKIDNRGGFFVSETKNHPPRFRSRSTEYAKFLVALLLTFPKKSFEESVVAAENCFNWTYKEYHAFTGHTYHLATGKQVTKANGGGVVLFTDTDGTTQAVESDSIYLVDEDNSLNIHTLE